MESYDIVLSIGVSCKTAFYLKIFKLREFANPMDWVICSFYEQINLYENKFNDFFDNYDEITNENIGEKDYRKVYDKKNKILSMHHIRKDIPLDEAIKEFKELMIKRYNRLNQKLIDSYSILLVLDEHMDIMTVKELLIRFSKIYPNKKITLINIYNSNYEEEKDRNEITNKITEKDKKIIEEEYKINNNLKIIRYIFNDTYFKIIKYPKENFKWIGNFYCWKKIMKNYKLAK